MDETSTSTPESESTTGTPTGETGTNSDTSTSTTNTEPTTTSVQYESGYYETGEPPVPINYTFTGQEVYLTPSQFTFQHDQLVVLEQIRDYMAWNTYVVVPGFAILFFIWWIMERFLKPGS